MVSFFERIPRELRDQIYCELLADNVLPIEPQGKRYPHEVTRKQLSLAILRVCRQAYSEASVVLYEQNIFRWNFMNSVFYSKVNGRSSLDQKILGYDRNDPGDAVGEVLEDDSGESGKDRHYADAFWRYGSRRKPFDIECLKKIKHFAIHYEVDAPSFTDRLNPIHCEEALGLVLEKFADYGCALKTLRLSFDVKGLAAYWRGKHHTKLEANSPCCKKIQNAVTSLRIEKKIEVVVNGQEESDCASFEDPLSVIADCRGWKITNLLKESETTKHEWSDEEDTTHLWTWTLAPTTTGMGEDGSQAVEPPILKED